MPVPSKKEIRYFALRIVHGKPIHWSWVSRVDEYVEAIYEMADLIRYRKSKRGQTEFIWKPERYCKKSDKKGSCSYCWPNEVGYRYSNHGRIPHNVARNTNRLADWLGEPLDFWRFKCSEYLMTYFLTISQDGAMTSSTHI